MKRRDRPQSGAEGRGQQVMLGLMFGVEGTAAGAGIAAANGVLWVLGAALGLVGIVVAMGLFLLIPRERRLAWSARANATREPDPAAVRRSIARDGGPMGESPRKPYWPE